MSTQPSQQKTLVRRVVIKNYRSIESCDVILGDLVYLVGPNGAGKSNFLDALRLIADALNSTLDNALRSRSGIKEVRRRSTGHPTHFTVKLYLSLDEITVGEYSIRIGAKTNGGYEVQEEQCKISKFMSQDSYFTVYSGEVTACSIPTPPPASDDRLYLVSVAGYPEFREVYDALKGLNFYSVNPERIREVQSPDSGEVLARDGWNLASVLRELARHPDVKERVEEYLSKVVPGVNRADYRALGPKETIEFRQHVKGATAPWTFFASNMSDGTLRALAILVALFQPKAKTSKSPAFVGIEEPEIALHPAAAGVLRDCLLEASQHTQIIVTSHSPELLDDSSISDASILAVSSSEGTTAIGKMDDAGREAIRNRLYTVGELLRLDQISPVEFTQEELLQSVKAMGKV